MKQVFAVADSVPVESRGYLTPGKMYPLTEDAMDGGSFIDDVGDEIDFAWTESGHLDFGNFLRVESDDLPQTSQRNDDYEAALRLMALLAPTLKPDEDGMYPTANGRKTLVGVYSLIKEAIVGEG